MHGILAIAKKDLRVLMRDWFGLFWIVAFPLVMAMFFGSMYGGKGGGKTTSEMSLLTIDQDQSDDSKAFLERLDKSDAAKLAYPKEEELKEQDPIEFARQQIRKGNHTAFLIVKKGFAENKRGPIPNAEYIKVGIDPSKKAEAGFLQGILMESIFGGMQEQFTDSAKFNKEIGKWKSQIDDDPKMAIADRLILKTFFGSLSALTDRMDPQKNPNAQNMAQNSPFASMRFEMEEVAATSNGPKVTNGFELSFPSAMSWAIIGCVASFVIGIVTEKSNGTYMRLRVAPIGRIQLLGGKALACFLACAGSIIVLLIFGVVAFNIRILNVPLLIMAVTCSSICYVGISMLISVMGRTERSVSGAVWGVNMPFAMLGGGMIPLNFMPTWMSTASNFTPTKWTIYSLEGAIWRGLSFTEMLRPCGILIAIGVVTFSIGVLVMIKRDE